MYKIWHFRKHHQSYLECVFKVESIPVPIFTNIRQIWFCGTRFQLFSWCRFTAQGDRKIEAKYEKNLLNTLIYWILYQQIYVACKLVNANIYSFSSFSNTYLWGTSRGHCRTSNWNKIFNCELNTFISCRFKLFGLEVTMMSIFINKYLS